MTGNTQTTIDNKTEFKVPLEKRRVTFLRSF